ncbi:MAG: response regulator [Chitinophagaceae bacterium]
MPRDKKRYNILVIEDNMGDFALINEYLEEQIADLAISHARNFKETRDCLIEHGQCYDVILLDLSLPDKSGELLIKEINPLCPECPVIVLTGYSDVEFSIRSLSLGMSDYLLKDEMSATSLYKSIIYSIERKKTSKQLEESEKRYINLFHLSPQPMFVYDPETFQFIQVNKATVENYGYSEKEFLDMTILDIRSEADALLLKESNLGVKRGDGLFIGTAQHYKKSKELMEVEIYSNPVLLDNKMYLSVIAIDVTEKKRLEREVLDQKVQEQKKITRAVVDAQEKERAGIGMELHDNINQLLAVSKLYLGQGLIQPDYLPMILKGQECIASAMHEIRKLSHALVGPTQDEKMGLIDSLEELMRNISIVQKLNIHLIHSTYHEEESEVGLKLVIYRIVQEQLNNIIKHANATEVQIELKKETGYLVVTIKDNGKGFDLSRKRNGIGLKNIKNRADIYNGAVQILSSPGDGCKMKIIFKTDEEELPVQEVVA